MNSQRFASPLATDRQHDYIRKLTQETGEPLSLPRYRHAASRQIQHLLLVKEARKVQTTDLLAG